MIKYKIKQKIVNCEKIESVTSYDLYPPPPVTNCHTFSDLLPPSERDILYGGPLTSLPTAVGTLLLIFLFVYYYGLF